MQKEKWYQTWFDTTYYHILYQHRDEIEAQNNIDSLLHYLNLPSETKILDLACGAGRYAHHIARKGYTVSGYDLSENNINKAKQFEDQKLHFEVRDMLKDLGNVEFDLVLNLFTSFGYFPTRQDHVLALKNIYKCLKPSGVFVLDYLNVLKIKENLVPEEHKNIDGIDFYIKRTWQNGFIEKAITVIDKDETYHFNEQVMGFTTKDFNKFFEEIGFEVLNLFGDFKLNSYNEKKSDRLIYVLKK